MHIKCCFCDKVLAKKETKNCGSCKAVIYCSRDCQKQSWRTSHKDLCARISNPQNANDELRLWCTLWSPSFVYATIWAMDIMNNPGHNMKYALLIFVKKTEKSDSAYRYKIFGQCFMPLSMPNLKLETKTITPGHFFLSIQDPVADDGFNLEWENPTATYECLFPSTSSIPCSASRKLAKLAVPILRHLTETASYVDAMTMWDPKVWLSRPHPLVKPEELDVFPEEFVRFADILK